MGLENALLQLIHFDLLLNCGGLAFLQFCLHGFQLGVEQIQEELRVVFFDFDAANAF